MIWAALWQRSRLTDVQERNATIVARTAEQTFDLAELQTSVTFDDGDAWEFRPVTVQGTFERADEVLVRSRPLDGAPGSWVLTPLKLSDGRAVVINRGWIPRSFGPDDPRDVVDPPAEAVTVGGYARKTQRQQGLGAKDAPTGVLSSLARADLERLAQQVDYELLPVFVQLEELQPGGVGPGELPIPLALPPLDEGPHFGYMVQWAIYATIGILGYPMILRRVARSRATDDS